MKQSCSKKLLPRGESVHWLLCLLLSLGVLAGWAGLAAAQYTRPTTKPPTQADLELQESKSKTVVVRLVNLTPYALEQDLAGISAGVSLDTNRKTAKSLMFAPVGWPGNNIPGLNGTWSQDPTSKEWAFTPDPNNNSSLHPYNFVMSWDDNGGYVTDNSMGWTIKDVYNTGHALTQDVPLRLWFSRIKPDSPLKSALDVFKVVRDAILEVIHLAEAVIDPTALSVWEVFVGAQETAEAGFEAANSLDDGVNPKMYVAAYPLPDNPKCGANCQPSAITTGSNGKSVDAVAAQWATDTGDYSSNVVVTTHLLRGENDGCAQYSTCGFKNDKVPIVHVVLWTPDLYTYATAKQGYSRAMKTPWGQRVVTALRSDNVSFTRFAYLYQSLTRAQKKTLHALLQPKRVVGPVQVILLKKIALALEAGPHGIVSDNQ